MNLPLFIAGLSIGAAIGGVIIAAPWIVGRSIDRHSRPLHDAGGGDIPPAGTGGAS